MDSTLKYYATTLRCIALLVIAFGQFIADLKYGNN